MALFEREDDLRPDAASRALSVTAVENDFVESVYEKLAKVYDLTFGPALHPGRLVALEGMGLRPGDRVLEVGRRHRHQRATLSTQLPDHRDRLLSKDAREGA